MNAHKFLKKSEQRLSSSSHAPFELTSMMDLVFMLLIFFVLTANVAQQTFNLSIPESDSSYQHPLQAEHQVIQITLFANNTYGYQKQRLSTYGELKLKIQEDKSSLDLSKAVYTIVNDKETRVKNLTKLLTFLQAEGITNVDLLLKSPSDSNSK